jgi:hypothetical protein
MGLIGLPPIGRLDPFAGSRLQWRFVSNELLMTTRDDFDPLAPHREAAFFYGLFLRGHSLTALREDIDVPSKVTDKWLKAKDFQGAFRADLDRVYQYRKRVLAIFEGLVSTEHGRVAIQ